MPEVTGIITDVTTKQGQSQKGPWTRYGVKIGNDWFSTFNHDHGITAAALKQDGKPARITYEIDGDYQNLTGIEEASVPLGDIPQGPSGVARTEPDDPPMRRQDWDLKERRNTMLRVWQNVYATERAQGMERQEASVAAYKYAIDVDTWLWNQATEEAPFD